MQPTMFDDELESTLDDGTRLLFRPIRPSDKGRIAEGLKHLSDESRYKRFFRHVDHFSEEQLRYLTEVDFRNHVAWIALLADAPGRPGVGVARWIRMPDEPTMAEGAVTVVDAYHGRGIGKTLLFLLARSAIPLGVRAFRAWVLGDNPRMLEVLERLGARSGRWESGVIEMTVPLPEDPALLDGTPAPLVLSAVARGDVEGHADPARPGATRLVDAGEDDVDGSLTPP